MYCVLAISLTALLTSARAVSYEAVVQEEWEAFKVEHGKFYQSEAEEAYRQTVYMENLRKIYEHNKQYELGLTSYKLAMNHLGDLTHEEFLQRYTSEMPPFPEDQLNTTETDLRDISENGDGSLMYDPVEDTVIDVPTLPTYVDWRHSGYVTGVKNQGSCGSCWSFSTTGALEGQWFRRTHRLVSLSEQNLMDCSWNYGNHGCSGGWMHSAFKYIIHNHGIDTEQSYPYQAHNGHCHYNPRARGATVSNMVAFSGENALSMRVATVGPIAIAAEVKGHQFMFYHSGVYDNPSCGRAINHAMLVVGYGNERGKNYWLVKNSWGNRWGEGGYIKMVRNRNSQCAIADYPVYPIV